MKLGLRSTLVRQEKQYKMKYNKLVRDNVPEIIVSDPNVIDIKIKKIKNRDELLSFVANKINEEADELAEAILAGDEFKLIEELADLKCIMNKAQQLFDITAKDVSDAYKEKAQKKGEFNTDTVLISVTQEDGDN